MVLDPQDSLKKKVIPLSRKAYTVLESREFLEGNDECTPQRQPSNKLIKDMMRAKKD